MSIANYKCLQCQLGEECTKEPKCDDKGKKDAWKLRARMLDDVARELRRELEEYDW